MRRLPKRAVDSVGTILLMAVEECWFSKVERRTVKKKIDREYLFGFKSYDSQRMRSERDCLRHGR